MKLEKLSMQFATHETSSAYAVLEAYERLIHDALIGDRTLFTSSRAIERLWEVSADVLADPGPVLPYAPGSWGPGAIHSLIAPHRWHLHDVSD
jgi:glucose-6-phosphate 1-dehydrogenase